jgi:putative NIF3 family GTP cyclohydrolase 1 type 2
VKISRRHFVTLAVAGTATARATIYSSPAVGAAITAQEIVDRIKQKSGVEWKPDTIDSFKAGDPATPVKGIAVATMATMSVLRQAQKAGANFIITAEPTFYARADSATPASARGAATAPDAIFAAKNEFIKNNGLVIWRFGDHWRQRTPDPFATGLIDTLGWSKLRTPGDPARVRISAAKLDALASELKLKLKAQGGIRVVGDPQQKVERIGLLPGTTAIQAALNLFPQVDTIIAGEVREWESVELARDKGTAGENKSLILLGRVLSEEPGMNACKQWIKEIVPELTATWIPVGDPYWRPS